MSTLESKEVAAVAQCFAKFGFAKLDADFTPDDLQTLESEAKRLLELNKLAEENKGDAHKSFRQPTFCSRDWSTLTNPIGLSKKFDECVERFLAQPAIQQQLEATLGKSYKLWELTIRQSEIQDEGLDFHLDHRGEVGLSIFLSDQNNIGGTTAVIPRSQNWHFVPYDIGIAGGIPLKTLAKLTKLPFVSRIIHPILGKKGDVFLFAKKGWHGRLPNDSGKKGLALMIGFFPAGYSFKPWNVPEEIHQGLGPTLKRLTDTKVGYDFSLSQTIPTVAGGLNERSHIIDSFYKAPRIGDLVWKYIATFPLQVFRLFKQVGRKFNGNRPLPQGH